MKKYITIAFFFLTLSAFGQNDFSTQIQKVADTISKKIIQTGNKKVAVTEFINLDESITQLGQFLCDELSSELSNLTENLTKFEVIERTNVDLIFKEKKLIQSVDGSKMARDVGKLNAADILIWAIISDFEGYYRVNIKLLDTKSGSALSSFKTQFIKSPTLESYNKQIIRKSETGVYQPPQESKLDSKISTTTDPCEQKLIGTLKVTNKIKEGVGYWGVTKIVIRIPKSSNNNSSNDNDYYFIILEKDETKEIVGLKEGTYEYDAKTYDQTASKGWNSHYGSTSSGQILITKCKPTLLDIR